jgi:sugar phosphate isomerase/epimerase
MILNRREMLAACAAVLPVLNCQAADDRRKRLGVVIYSYSIRSGRERTAAGQGFQDPLTFLEHCHKLGAGGIQVSIGTRDFSYTARLREKLAATEMYLEGIVRLPKDQTDLERFTAEVRTAKEAGVSVLRTAMFNGRRYEAFDTAAAFRKAADHAYRSLELAEPAVARAGLRLAIENHKDWRTGELIEILKRLKSRQVGVCVDTGNSIALLEDPLEVVETYAPWAITTHLKDMAVAEYEDGFLLAEVPLGQGFLDLKRMVGILRRAQPEIRFNLEMITRDPLKVPCLTPKYWETSAELPGRYLAQMLTLVRKRASQQPLPRISKATPDQQLAAEERNVQESLAYARKYLDL